MDTTFSLEPVPPFRLDLTVWVLRRRPDNSWDRWDGETYRRTLPTQNGPLDVAVRQAGPPEAGNSRSPRPPPRCRRRPRRSSRQL